MVVSENGGFSPQIIHFDRDFHYKSSILGYPYFWKHPYTWGNHGKWSNSTGAWGAEAKVWQEWTPGFQQRNLLCFAWSTLFIFMLFYVDFFKGVKLKKGVCFWLYIFYNQSWVLKTLVLRYQSFFDSQLEDEHDSKPEIVNQFLSDSTNLSNFLLWSFLSTAEQFSSRSFKQILPIT